MSSIGCIILYHLTDGLITETFSCQIPVYPLHFPLIRARRVKPLFLQEPPYRFSLSALITTRFKGIIDQFCRHAFLLELRPDFLRLFIPCRLRTKFSAYRASLRYPKDLTYSTAASMISGGYMPSRAFRRAHFQCGAYRSGDAWPGVLPVSAVPLNRSSAALRLKVLRPPGYENRKVRLCKVQRRISIYEYFIFCFGTGFDRGNCHSALPPSSASPAASASSAPGQMIVSADFLIQFFHQFRMRLKIDLGILRPCPIFSPS